MARPGFTICVCPDRYLVRTHIEAALGESIPEGGSLLGAAAPAAWERHAFWGDDPLPSRFWEHLTLQGLVGTPKAVIVHNAQNIPADGWKKISSVLGSPNADTWPFFCLYVAFERGKPKIPAHIANLACMRFAAEQGWVWSSPGLDERGKTRFVQEEAQKRGLSFAPGALEAVASRLPPDAAAIGTELDKLALAATRGVIAADLADILDHEAEPDVFSLIRDLQQRRGSLSVWEQALASGRGSDSMAFAFLAMLTREARQLWQIAAGEPVRLPPQVISAKTALARSLGLAGIAKLWHLALEADKGVKTGERTPDQALDNLLASLSLLFSSSGGAGR
ncbi:MAG: DNA polymerase III subunit delta [Deltaproteobacteria bacterium]|nr:DNA polymerase III subunit delta [Deltaproteobacteria bacterium]